MRSSQNGFTLVELILTLVLIGIVASIAGPRFFQLSSFRDGGFAQEVTAAIRYGQKVALASRCDVGVRVDSGGVAYGLYWQGGTGCPANGSRLPRPGAQAGDYELASTDIAIVGSLDFSFDGQGIPDMVESLSITVGSRTVRVEARTGLTYVQ